MHDDSDIYAIDPPGVLAWQFDTPDRGPDVEREMVSIGVSEQRRELGGLSGSLLRDPPQVADQGRHILTIELQAHRGTGPGQQAEDVEQSDAVRDLVDRAAHLPPPGGVQGSAVKGRQQGVDQPAGLDPFSESGTDEGHRQPPRLVIQIELQPDVGDRSRVADLLPSMAEEASQMRLKVRGSFFEHGNSGRRCEMAEIKRTDVERFTESVVGALEDRDSLREKSEAGMERARKYGCGVSVQAMLDRLERLQEAPGRSVRRP